MTHLSNFLLLGMASAVVTCATDRSLTGFGAALWRSWLIANFAVYVSSIVGGFTQYEFQMPSGPENVFAVFILIPLQMLLGTAIIVQPLLLITIMTGLVVCLPLAQFIFSMLDDGNVSSSATKRDLPGKWSMSLGSLIISIVFVTTGYAVLTVKAIQKEKPIPTPATVKRELWNFQNLEITEFSYQVSARITPNGQASLRSIRGTCVLTTKAIQGLLEKYDWQKDDLSKSDNAFLAKTFSECVSSSEFDRTFEQNPKYRFGNALLDKEQKIMYFEVSSPEIAHAPGMPKDNSKRTP